jgi:hypothetical protein
MGVLDAIKAQMRPAPGHIDAVEVTPAAPVTNKKDAEKNDIDVDIEAAEKPVLHAPVESGVARVEAVQAVWGKHGKWIIICGLAMMMTI